MLDHDDAKKRLQAIAYAATQPFCYLCYKIAPTGRCQTCGTDDLMRHLHGVGVEYGIDWVVRHLLESELNPADIEEQFEDMIRDCYGETVKVGWMELDTVDILKEWKTDWRCTLSDYESQIADDGHLISFDNGCTYYWEHEVENFIEEQESELGLPEEEIAS